MTTTDDDDTAIRRLAHLQPDLDTQQLLQQLVAKCQLGGVAGVAVIAFAPHKDGGKRSYNLYLSGYAKNNPTLAAGAFSACELLMRERALKHANLR